MDRIFKRFGSSDHYGVQSAQLKDSGNYSCEVKTFTTNVSKRSKMLPLQIKELFSQPEIKLIQHPAVEGDHVTLTCDTSLSPLRPRTELQFAFHKDGQNIQRFGSSDQYGIQSAQLKDSGNYCCEVKTFTTNVSKRSKLLPLQIKELFSQPEIKLIQHPAVEGDHVTLTCDTSLSPLRPRTELQFAFHKDGQNIQRFGSSDHYGSSPLS
ncbi:unnamed protein product [Staurois parvus]|uniref:Ig-like domain-containing protein n=1 Tax=Staurois parvus TaxID=386267 RepID=A0ABN9GYL4_9NEOB|nr:unnamed protein product [Staurois parvus]